MEGIDLFETPVCVVLCTTVRMISILEMYAEIQVKTRICNHCFLAYRCREG